ncbi:MAG: hypothetical protein KKD75_06245 [Nanoarchaeota archaeon]|nr:hypothetical protein [Nanoarchaeota archaeon]MBU1631583.1 hypothetical protein [Nanoarchaeota archaeon]MBU1876121.1 hypothetical protein [Nanoarchaeota archaeon]
MSNKKEKKMMNKKAALFHWIIFGVLAALGIFLVTISDIDTGSRIKGEWQLNFLDNYYLEAEKDLLYIDQAAKIVVWQTVLESAGNGGFITEGSCGNISSYNLWNELNRWNECLPDINKTISLKVKEGLAESLPNREYDDIKIDGNGIIGKGKKSSILSTSGKFVNYTYDTNFKVDLGFNIKTDYNILRIEAVQLVDNCRNFDDLERCIKEKKKNNWKFKNCGVEEYREDGKKVIFCVESPQQAKIYNNTMVLVPLRYKFALDFSSIDSSAYLIS